MVELIKFEPDHARQLQIRDLEGGLRKMGGVYWDKCLQANADDGPAYTGIMNGRVVGCGGVRVFWEGVGEAWAIYDVELAKRPRLLLRYSRALLERIITEQRLWRVQATARVDFPGAANFLEHLGFEIESVLHRFAPDGVDCFVYTRITEHG